MIQYCTVNTVNGAVEGHPFKVTVTPQSFKPITTPGTEITVLSQWLNNFLKVYFHLLTSGYWVVY